MSISAFTVLALLDYPIGNIVTCKVPIHMAPSGVNWQNVTRDTQLTEPFSRPGITVMSVASVPFLQC